MEIGREIVAYGLIAATVLVLVPLTIVRLSQRRRMRMRRRGDKRYGH